MTLVNFTSVHSCSRIPIKQKREFINVESCLCLFPQRTIIKYFFFVIIFFCMDLSRAKNKTLIHMWRGGNMEKGNYDVAILKNIIHEWLEDDQEQEIGFRNFLIAYYLFHECIFYMFVSKRLLWVFNGHHKPSRHPSGVVTFRVWL